MGQNFVGQDVTGAISLAQEVSGAGGSGAGSREFSSDPSKFCDNWPSKGGLIPKSKIGEK